MEEIELWHRHAEAIEKEFPIYELRISTWQSDHSFLSHQGFKAQFRLIGNNSTGQVYGSCLGDLVSNIERLVKRAFPNYKNPPVVPTVPPSSHPIPAKPTSHQNPWGRKLIL